MFKIGNIEIKGKVVLAPMAGITSIAYRNFMKDFGVSLVVTEMVSDCGLIYENLRTKDYIVTSEKERPVAIQLFGSDADKIIEAMKIVERDNPNFDMFDINLGCPVKKVVNSGAGSALLKNPQELGLFMKKIVSSTSKPVTAKIRLGYDEESINFRENIKALENAGVAAIGIHSRTRTQMYAGKARHELIANLRDEMKVPLIVSGDIFTLDDAIRVMKLTKADAIMVARGGVGNPNLVKQIDTYYKTGEKLPNISVEENIQNLLKFTDMLIEEKGEFRAIRILRGIAPKFFDGYIGMKKLKNAIGQNITTYESLIRILNEYGFNVSKHE